MATITVTPNSTYKSLVIVAAITGGYTGTLYYYAPGSTTAVSLGAISTGTSTYYYHADGSIDTSATAPVVFPDGVYEFYISETDGATTTVSDSSYAFMKGNVMCCLSTKIASIAEQRLEDCCCKDRAIDILYTMYVMLDSAEYDCSSNCGDYTKAQAKLQMVVDYCARENDCICTECNDCN